MPKGADMYICMYIYIYIYTHIYVEPREGIAKLMVRVALCIDLGFRSKQTSPSLGSDSGPLCGAAVGFVLAAHGFSQSGRGGPPCFSAAYRDFSGDLARA